MPKNDLNLEFVKEGSIIFKSQFNILARELRFIYILGPLKKEKLKLPSTMKFEEVKNIIRYKERDTAYGNVSTLINHFIIDA